MTTKFILLLVWLLASSGFWATAAEAVTNAGHAFEQAAKEAEAAVTVAKGAAEKAAVAHSAAQQAAAAKRQQANDAKKKADDLLAQQQKPAEARLAAAAQSVTNASNAKVASDKALADANAALALAQQKQQEAQKQASAAAQKLTEATAQMKSAEDTLGSVAKQMAPAIQARQAAEQAAKAAEAAAAMAKAEMDKSQTALAAAEKTAADKRAALDATTPEGKAKSNYEAAGKAAQDAEAAVVPLRTAMQKADAAYAEAKKVADAKRQKATESKNLSGDPGVQELKQAEANLPAAIKALTEATNAKPPLDEALVKAKAGALPLQQAYDAAEKEAKQAEAAAKAASEAANKLDNDAKKAAALAGAKRRAAEVAKAALVRAQQAEQNLQSQAKSAGENLADGEKQKKEAEDASTTAKSQVAATTAALAAAEKAAQEAEAKAKQFAAEAARPDAEKKQAADDAAGMRKAADAAKAARAGAQQAEQAALAQTTAAAKALTRAMAQKKVAEAGMAGTKKQLANATAAMADAEKAAQELEKAAEQAKKAADEAAAKRKAAAEASAALSQAQQREQQAQSAAKAAAQKLAEAQAAKNSGDAALAKSQPSQQPAQAQVNAAAQKVSEAEAQRKSADDALVKAKSQVVAATAAQQAAVEAARELLRLDAASKQAAEQAAARRKAANEAKAALDPKAKAQEQAAVQANTAAQTLTRAEGRKKAAEEALANLKQRIASAKETHVADEEAAQKAEAVAAPLKVEAEKTRAAYLAAKNIADDKRALAQKSKGALYRLVAAGQVTNLMESPEPPKPVNRVDDVIFAKLKTLGIEPALCSDAVFVRRACLDLTGKLPTAEEARVFIKDSDRNKRVALVSRLLEDAAHVDYWAMKWSDILRVKAEFPVKVWPNAAQAYHRWIWEAIARNKPYDRFARELLTSSGSNYRVGAVNFYRAIQNRTPEGIAAVASLAFMGTRVHTWPADRQAGMAVFFSQVGYKPTSEWKEEIIFWDPLNSTAVPGSTAPGIDDVAKSVKVSNQIPQGLPKPVSENGPLAATFPDGVKATIPPNRDPREVFADWLIRPENPWFTKAVVNRTWAWAMGRGIIHEPDDIRENNPPSDPELLACLEKELVSSGYDLRRLKRLIFTSTAYQFSSIPKGKGAAANTNFASYAMRRVEAEVLIDALNELTGSTDLYTSAVPEPFTYIPDRIPAVALADGSVTSPFLTLFGRSARATGMENERVNELASSQWLHMLNSATIQGKLQAGPKLAAVISSGGKAKEIAENLYLTILSRFPTEADLKAAEAYAQTGVTKGREVWIDLAWALINSPEFLLRH